VSDGIPTAKTTSNSHREGRDGSGWGMEGESLTKNRKARSSD